MEEAVASAVSPAASHTAAAVAAASSNSTTTPEDEIIELTRILFVTGKGCAACWPDRAAEDVGRTSWLFGALSKMSGTSKRLIESGELGAPAWVLPREQCQVDRCR